MKKVIFRMQGNSALYALTSPDFAHKEFIFSSEEKFYTSSSHQPGTFFVEFYNHFFRWTPRICFQA